MAEKTPEEIAEAYASGELSPRDAKNYRKTLQQNFSSNLWKNVYQPKIEEELSPLYEQLEYFKNRYAEAQKGEADYVNAAVERAKQGVLSEYQNRANSFLDKAAQLENVPSEQFALQMYGAASMQDLFAKSGGDPNYLNMLLSDAENNRQSQIQSARGMAQSVLSDGQTAADMFVRDNSFDIGLQAAEQYRREYLDPIDKEGNRVNAQAIKAQNQVYDKYEREHLKDVEGRTRYYEKWGKDNPDADVTELRKVYSDLFNYAEPFTPSDFEKYRTEVDEKYTAKAEKEAAFQRQYAADRAALSPEAMYAKYGVTQAQGIAPTKFIADPEPIPVQDPTIPFQSLVPEGQAKELAKYLVSRGNFTLSDVTDDPVGYLTRAIQQKGADSVIQEINQQGVNFSGFPIKVAPEIALDFAKNVINAFPPKDGVAYDANAYKGLTEQYGRIIQNLGFEEGLNAIAKANKVDPNTVINKLNTTKNQFGVPGSGGGEGIEGEEAKPYNVFEDYAARNAPALEGYTKTGQETFDKTVADILAGKYSVPTAPAGLTPEAAVRQVFQQKGIDRQKYSDAYSNWVDIFSRYGNDVGLAMLNERQDVLRPGDELALAKPVTPFQPGGAYTTPTTPGTPFSGGYTTPISYTPGPSAGSGSGIGAIAPPSPPPTTTPISPYNPPPLITTPERAPLNITGYSEIPVGERMYSILPIEPPTEAASTETTLREGGRVSRTAKGLASLGRDGDTMLVHMAPEEVAGLRAIALKEGTDLTINPETGLPEARKLKDIFRRVILPAAAAYFGAPYLGGIGNAAMLIGTGAALKTGNFQEGLQIGLAAYGGANLASSAFGAPAAGAAGTTTTTTTGAPSATGPTVGAEAGGGAASTAYVNPGVASTQMQPIDMGYSYSPATAYGSMGELTQAGVAAGIDPASLISNPAGAVLPPVSTSTGAVSTAAGGTQVGGGGKFEQITGMSPTTALIGGTMLAGLSEGEKERDLYEEERRRQQEEEERRRRLGAESFARANQPIDTRMMYGAGGGLVALARGGMTYMEAGGTTGPTGEPRMVAGTGDGMSDSVPATIEGVQEARLANDEFVIPADVVADIGNGSSSAGAKKLYDMMDRIREARHGTTEQPPEIRSEQYMPA